MGDVEGDGDFVLSYQPWTLAEFPRLLHPRHREAWFHQAVVDPFDFGLVFCDAAHRAVFQFRLNCANSAANLPTAWPFPTLDQFGQNIVTTRKFKNVNQINHVLSHIRWKLEQIKISFLSCKKKKNPPFFQKKKKKKKKKK